MLERDPRDFLQQLPREMAGRTVAGRAVREVALLFGVGDEFLRGADRQRRMGDQHHHALRHHRHRLEVPDRIVRQVLRVQRHRADHRPDVSHNQVVAVGRRFGDDVGGNGAAGAGAAVDDHRLAPAFGELQGEVARQVIGGAARALAEDADRPRRVARGRVLRVRERRAEKKRCRECKVVFHVAAHLGNCGAGRPPRRFAPPLLIRGGEKNQSSFAPAAWTILPIFAISALICAANCSGVFATGSIPSLSRRSRKSARLMIVTESSWIFFTISRGVPAGAMKPYQAWMSKPGSVSAIAGTSGSAFARRGLVTPSAFNLPLFVIWIDAVIPPKISGTWLASTSAIPWPKPL